MISLYFNFNDISESLMLTFEKQKNVNLEGYGFSSEFMLDMRVGL